MKWNKLLSQQIRTLRLYKRQMTKFGFKFKKINQHISDSLKFSHTLQFSL